jgi:hypothetical protein
MCGIAWVFQLYDMRVRAGLPLKELRGSVCPMLYSEQQPSRVFKISDDMLHELNFRTAIGNAVIE